MAYFWMNLRLCSFIAQKIAGDFCQSTVIWKRCQFRRKPVTMSDYDDETKGPIVDLNLYWRYQPRQS